MSLKVDRTIDAINELDALDRDIDRKRQEFLDHGFDTLLAREQMRGDHDKAAIARLYAVRSALLKNRQVSEADLQFLRSRGSEEAESWIGLLISWNDALAARNNTETRARQLFAAELAECRAKIWTLARDPGLLEAIFLSSPSAAESLIKRSWSDDLPRENDSKTRGLERRLYTYLQRFCAKNDTTSFFGPVDYGDFSEDCHSGLTAEPGWNARASSRRVFWAHWVVSALARKIAEDEHVFRELRPRRSPLLRVVDAARGIFFMHGAARELQVSGPTCELLLQIDGRTTVAQLTRASALAQENAKAVLLQLASARLIDIDLPVPSTAVDAFGALQRTLDDLAPRAGQRAQTWLDTAEQLRHGVETASWPERIGRFEAAERWVASNLGDSARRNQGALYADRLVLYEDCAGSLRSLAIGGPVLARIERQLPDVLEFLTGVAVLRWYDAQAAVRKQLAAKKGAANFIDLLATRSESGPEEPRFSAFATRLRDLIAARRRPDRIELSTDDLRDVIAPWRADIDEALARFPMILPSPDLMIAARSMEQLQANDFELILAELHDDCSTLFDGFFACFHREPQQLRGILESEIMAEDGWQVLGTVLGSRRNKHVTPELPGTTIVLSGVSGRSSETTVPIAEVEIADEAGCLVLKARGQPVMLYPGDVGSLVQRAFALPCIGPIDWLAIAGTERIPRVIANGVVVQRAAWDIASESLRIKPKGELDLAEFRTLRSRLAALGIPDCYFVRWAREEKPVMIDARNPLALDLLRRLTSSANRFRMTEMYPGPDDIFWNSSRGRHTFELRTGLIRRNPGTRNPRDSGR